MFGIFIIAAASNSSRGEVKRRTTVDSNAGYLSSVTGGKRLKKRRVMTKVTPSDVLRLSGLFDSCKY